MSHKCPACGARLKAKELACKKHWRLLPTKLQIEILDAYRTPGPKAQDRYQTAMDQARQIWT